MARQVPLLGYPSQLAAVTALMAQGLRKRAIMDRTGLSGDRTSNLMSLARRAAARKAARPGWTIDRVGKAIRIYKAALAVIAEAFGVGVDELLEVVTHDVAAVSVVAAGEPAAAAAAPAAAPEPAASPAPAPSPEAANDADPAVPAAELFQNGRGFVAAAAEADPEPDPFAELDEDGRAIAGARRGALFVLRSADGEVLHESCSGLTRLPKFFWRGNAQQLRAVRRRYPKWRHLKAEAV